MGKGRGQSPAGPSRKKKRRSRADRVYDWEAKWYHWNQPGWDLNKGAYFARDWLKWALKKYGVKKIPKIRLRHDAEHSFFRPHDWLIQLKAPQHVNLASVLHEAAHAIYAWYYGRSDEHNEKWLGIYVWLMGHSTVVPIEALRGSLNAEGLKYSHMMTPKVLKKKAPAA